MGITRLSIAPMGQATVLPQWPPRTRSDARFRAEKSTLQKVPYPASRKSYRDPQARTSRHASGTLLKSRREDMMTLQALLRHANDKITLDVYTQAVKQSIPNRQIRFLDSNLARLSNRAISRIHKQHQKHLLLNVVWQSSVQIAPVHPQLPILAVSDTAGLIRYVAYVRFFEPALETDPTLPFTATIVLE